MTDKIIEKNKKQRTKLFETCGMVNLALTTIWNFCPSVGLLLTALQRSSHAISYQYYNVARAVTLCFNEIQHCLDTHEPMKTKAIKE